MINDQHAGALHQPESNYKKLESIILRQTPGFILLHIEGAVKKITGYNPTDFTGKKLHWREIIHPDDQPQVYHMCPLLHSQHNSTIEREYRIIHKDGTIKWITEIIQNIIDNHDGSIFVQSVIHDVTRRKQIELERNQLIKRLQEEQKETQDLKIQAEKHASEVEALFVAMADPLLVYSLNGIVVNANPAARTIFGFNPISKTREEIARLLQMSNLDGTPLTVDQMLTVQATIKKEIVSRPIKFINFNKEEVTVLVSASPVFQDKLLTGTVATMHDISDRAELEKQKDAFISIASHELKTPLTTLKALTQLHQKKVINCEPECQSYLQKTSGYIDRLLFLTERMLDVGRIQTGQLELNKEKLDFNELIKQVIEEIQATTVTHQIILKGKANDFVYVDRNRMIQVLTNLLYNAIKYSPLSKKVIVQLINRDLNLEVIIRDFGVGVNKEHQKKIFNRFYRIKGAQGERFAGLGLGLYISQEIIRKHKGKIWVKSFPGKGSSFHLLISKKQTRSFNLSKKYE